MLARFPLSLYVYVATTFVPFFTVSSLPLLSYILVVSLPFWSVIVSDTFPFVSCMSYLYVTITMSVCAFVVGLFCWSYVYVVVPFVFVAVSRFPLLSYVWFIIVVPACSSVSCP